MRILAPPAFLGWFVSLQGYDGVTTVTMDNANARLH